MERSGVIIKTSIIGISVNVVLAVFKAVVGLVSGSIAITLDAVNNLSDALSSVITIIGTRIAAKRPDKAHPFGHGRVEYLSASVIAFIVLYAGVTALIESVKKIISPSEPEYTAVTLIIVAVAVIVKFLLGRYYVRVGNEVESDSLVASGKDASLDAAVSLSTLVSAVIFISLHLNLEAYLGVLISLLLIRTGVELLRDTISQIVGERPSTDKAREIKNTVASFPEVSGVYDLVLHNYGPDYLIGSVHIEVPDTMTADKIDLLEREIVQKVYAKCAVIMAGISVYAKNTRDDEIIAVQNDIRRRIMAHDYVLQMHGFYLDNERRTIQFDLVIDFDAPDRHRVFDEVVAEIREAYPDYSVTVAFDEDLSD